MLLFWLSFLGLYVFWMGDCLSSGGSFSLISYDSFPEFGFLVDESSMICFFMLICCGYIALFYCFHYFSGDANGGLLFPLVIWFLGVMALLMFSSSLLYSLVLWEYLGLVSFFLILFYSNSSSLRASLITLFASRFGDVSLFLLIMWLSWWSEVSSLFFVVLFLLIVMTKSACFPFISWLLEAMRAPTPVSSLVHSSTLVAAGVWFVLRYNCYSMGCLFNSFGVFCLLTILITPFAAVVFMDLKNIVPLSTCNNVSWCLLFFICGNTILCLIQLITHGVCKCYLFMSVGDLLSQSGSSQNAVDVYLSSHNGLFLPVVQAFLVFSLCGVPFLGVFFSKHLLFSGLLYGGGLGLVVVMICCLMMSYVYSVRFALLLLNIGGGSSGGYSSIFTIICPLVFAGTFMNFWWCLITAEVVSLSVLKSLSVLLIQLLGCWLGYLCYSGLEGFGHWCSLLSGCEGYVSLFYSGFLSSSNVCVVSFYRWEVYLLNGLLNFSSRGWMFNKGSMFYLNVLVLGLFIELVISYVFS
uniref:NADH:ubiquinone reductase (H(+)-translocating) n=1 Tax=Echinostoma hortense TaxID=48216 RepID=A0A0M4JKH1_9TREM|nr:NADH dehydrogenase subunit 5 [Echinostoma hortense]